MVLYEPSVNEPALAPDLIDHMRDVLASDRLGVAGPPGGDLYALWVIEGAGAYGGPVAHVVAETGYEVVEAAQMSAAASVSTTRSTPAASPPRLSRSRSRSCATHEQTTASEQPSGSCLHPAIT